MSEEKRCENPVYARFTWPGNDEKYTCALHAMKLAQLAEIMGFHLQIIPLTVGESADKQCNQYIRGEKGK